MSNLKVISQLKSCINFLDKVYLAYRICKFKPFLDYSAKKYKTLELLEMKMTNIQEILTKKSIHSAILLS